MKVLYEDNHLLIVRKKAGMLTQPDSSGRESVEDLAKQYIKQKYNKPGAVFLHAAHRLDKPVGGIVVFARTSKALSRLNESLREGKWHRHYRAWVEGEVEIDKTLEHYLLRTEEKSEVVNSSTPGAKLARLHVKTIEKKQGRTLLDIELDTGRHHQIRLQLAANGTPIIGDGRYSGQKQAETIELEHYKLIFPHPITSENLIIN